MHLAHWGSCGNNDYLGKERKKTTDYFLVDMKYTPNYRMTLETQQGKSISFSHHKCNVFFGFHNFVVCGHICSGLRPLMFGEHDWHGEHGTSD